LVRFRRFILTLALQCKNLLVGMHNGRIGTDWSPEDIVGVREVNDDDLILLIDLFAHTDKMVRLEG
jgi:hypothetical protein